jgi:hypothetical protein
MLYDSQVCFSFHQCALFLFYAINLSVPQKMSVAATQEEIINTGMMDHEIKLPTRLLNIPRPCSHAEGERSGACKTRGHGPRAGHAAPRAGHPVPVRDLVALLHRHPPVPIPTCSAYLSCREELDSPFCAARETYSKIGSRKN